MPPKLQPVNESDSEEQTLQEIQQFCLDQHLDLWTASSQNKPEPIFEDFVGKKPLTDEEFDYFFYIKNEYDTDTDSEEETLID